MAGRRGLLNRLLGVREPPERPPEAPLSQEGAMVPVEPEASVQTGPGAGTSMPEIRVDPSMGALNNLGNMQMNRRGVLDTIRKGLAAGSMGGRLARLTRHLPDPSHTRMYDPMESISPYTSGYEDLSLNTNSIREAYGRSIISTPFGGYPQPNSFEEAMERAREIVRNRDISNFSNLLVDLYRSQGDSTEIAKVLERIREFSPDAEEPALRLLREGSREDSVGWGFRELFNRVNDDETRRIINNISNNRRFSDEEIFRRDFDSGMLNKHIQGMSGGSVFNDILNSFEMSDIGHGPLGEHIGTGISRQNFDEVIKDYIHRGAEEIGVNSEQFRELLNRIGRSMNRERYTSIEDNLWEIIKMADGELD